MLKQHRHEWLQMEARDIVRIYRNIGNSREDAQFGTLTRLKVEMRLDGLSYEEHQAEVDAIVEDVLNELYGERDVEEHQKMETHDQTAMATPDTSN